MGPAVRIRRSTIVNAPVDEVWAVLRDFNGHDRWHPAVGRSAIEAGEPADMVGAVRSFTLADGGRLREQLLALSDRDHAFSYCLLEAPVPLMGYVAHVWLKPVTDGGRTFWEWRSTFHPPTARRAALAELVEEGIYKAGFAAIRRLFAQRPGLLAPVAVRGSAAPFAEAAPQSDAPPDPAPRPRHAARQSPAAMPYTGQGERTAAIVVEHHGGPEVMTLREIALPRPAAGEVRLRHTAIGVNFIDVYCRSGAFDLLTPPGVPGMEAAGVVEEVGTAVADLRPGDRVAYACPPVGAYAQARNMAPDLLVRLSPDIPDAVAAAGLLKGVTASFLLHDVHPVRAGQTVLVHAAAGGVGQLLVQWARHLGATVIAVVSTEEKAALARDLGAHHAIVRMHEDFAEAVRRLTQGRGVEVAYDAVGRDTFAGTLEALGERGHLVSFGQASGPVGSQDIGRLSAKSVTLSRPNYGHYTDTPEKLGPHVRRFLAAYRQRVLRLGEPTIYPLAEAARAHRGLESRATTGSLLLIP